MWCLKGCPLFSNSPLPQFSWELFQDEFRSDETSSVLLNWDWKLDAVGEGSICVTTSTVSWRTRNEGTPKTGEPEKQINNLIGEIHVRGKENNNSNKIKVIKKINSDLQFFQILKLST